MGSSFLLSNLSARPRKQASASLGNRGGFVLCATLERFAPAAESARGIEGVGTSTVTASDL